MPVLLIAAMVIAAFALAVFFFFGDGDDNV